MIKKFRKKGSPDPLKNLVTHMLERITSATPFIVIEKVLIVKLIKVIYSLKIRCKRLFHF